jgi:hypothetical protein
VVQNKAVKDGNTRFVEDGHRQNRLIYALKRLDKNYLEKETLGKFSWIDNRLTDLNNLTIYDHGTSLAGFS